MGIVLLSKFSSVNRVVEVVGCEGDQTPFEGLVHVRELRYSCRRRWPGCLETTVSGHSVPPTLSRVDIVIWFNAKGGIITCIELATRTRTLLPGSLLVNRALILEVVTTMTLAMCDQ